MLTTALAVFLLLDLMDYQPATKELLPVISKMLTDHVTSNDAVSAGRSLTTELLAFHDSHQDSPGENFYSLRAPDITVEAYLETLNDHLHCSTKSWVIGLIYIHRLLSHNPYMMLTSKSMHLHDTNR
eukprot:201189_1